MIPIRRIICLFSILALFCVAGIHGADAEVHTVAPTGAEFTSIQAAIDWAYPGDTVRVQSGIYTEEIRLIKKLPSLVSTTGEEHRSSIPEEEEMPLKFVSMGA